MSPDRDVLVLGGGVIGLTVAYTLARERLRVAVLDRGDFGQEASWAGAGIIPPGNPTKARSAYDLLRAHSSALYPSLSAELRERTGIDNGYRRSGGLEIADGVGEAANEWRGEGITFELLRERDLLRLEPKLAPGLDAAYHLPDMAQVRNPRHVKALVAGCASWGAELLPGQPVHGFERRGSRITAALTGLDALAADRYVIAAGAWSEALLQPLGFRPGIHPVRGQIALLRTEAAPFRHVLLHGKRYLVPRPDGRVLAGSTEEDAGFDKRTTATAIRQLLDFAVSLVPALGESPLERCWAGLRPGTLDELPFIGRVPGLDNLFVAAGHFRAGIQLSPATGLLLKELLLDLKPTVPLEAFRLDREPSPPCRPAFLS